MASDNFSLLFLLNTTTLIKQTRPKILKCVGVILLHLIRFILTPHTEKNTDFTSTKSNISGKYILIYSDPDEHRCGEIVFNSAWNIQFHTSFYLFVHYLLVTDSTLNKRNLQDHN